MSTENGTSPRPGGPPPMNNVSGPGPKKALVKSGPKKMPANMKQPPKNNIGPKQPVPNPQPVTSNETANGSDPALENNKNKIKIFEQAAQAESKAASTTTAKIPPNPALQRAVSASFKKNGVIPSTNPPPANPKTNTALNLVSPRLNNSAPAQPVSPHSPKVENSNNSTLESPKVRVEPNFVKKDRPLSSHSNSEKEGDKSPLTSNQNTERSTSRRSSSASLPLSNENTDRDEDSFAVDKGIPEEDSSSSELEEKIEADEATTRMLETFKAQTGENKPTEEKKSLNLPVNNKPRAQSKTVRRLDKVPPVLEEDFEDEWSEFPVNKYTFKIIQEPDEYIMPGECVAIRVRICEDKSKEHKVAVAMLYRYEGDNGILFQIKLENEAKFYLLIRLVIDDENHLVLARKDPAVKEYDRVIETQEYTKARGSGYYRPKSQAVYNSIGALIDKNDLMLYLKIAQRSPVENSDAAPKPYRILLNALNQFNPSDHCVTRKILAVDRITRNTKQARKELISFFRSFDHRSSEMDDKLTAFEKTTVPVEQEEIMKDITELLFKASKENLRKQYFNGKTLLHYACLLEAKQYVSYLLSKCDPNDVNLIDMNTRGALFYAVESGNKDIVEMLVTKGANVSCNDTRGESIHNVALRLNRIEVLHYLNERNKPATNSITQSLTETQLHDAAQNDNVEELQQLLSSKGSNVNAKNLLGATSLHIAASKGSLTAIDQLLNAGANPNEKDNDGSTPLHQAVASGRLDIVTALLKATVEVNSKDATEATPLNLATMQKQDEIAMLLLECGADPNIPNEQAFTPLHYASAYGELKTASALIERGANIKAVTKEMSTPLHQAAFNGHANVVKLLIEKGAEMEFGNSKALHLACFNGHASVVKILLEKGANVNCTDEELSTPLHKATYNGHVECLKILVEQGKADLNCKDAEGATPLHKAAFSAKDECLQYLLSQGAEVDSEDNCQGTSLHNAAFRGHATTAELLVKAKANINKGDDRGATPLHLAALGNGLDCLKYLIKQGANIEAVDVGGMTPLMYSVGHLDIVKFLLTQKLDVNRTDKKGRSALLHAIVKRHEEVAKVLIEHGADPNKKDNEGRMPIELVSPAFKEIINDAVKMRQKGAFDEKTQAKFAEAVKRFNAKPKTGVEYLISEGLVDKNNFAQDMAFFLQKENDQLSRKIMGDYLGTKENFEVLTAFTNRLNFEGMEFDQAFRVFLTKFRLPGEAQMIDRCMQRFSARYCENNPDFFPDEDTAYMIAFSLIMLHTDAHNPNVKDKMTKSHFIKNSHGLWAGQDPPQEFLERMYDSVVENEIKLDSDDLVVIEKKGWLKRQTDGRNKKWSPRYFILKDQVLYYYKSQEDSDNPNGLIPLENVVVKPREEKKKIVRFALVAADGGPIKSCKMEKGKLMQGNHKELFFTAENSKENEEWIEAIRGSIANNPFYHLITKRMEELASAKSTNAAVNFQEIYDLALLCQSCASGDEAAIKDTYGPYVLVVDQVMGIKFMVITNGDYKRTQIVLTGDMFDESGLKVSQLNEPSFDFKTFFKIETIVEQLQKAVESHLLKGYALQLIGHSLGSIISVFLAIKLQQKRYKVTKIVNFAQPNFMLEQDANTHRTLSVMRIVDVKDPIYDTFAGHLHVGYQLSLVGKSAYCFENKMDLHSLSSPTLSVNNNGTALTRESKDVQRPVMTASAPGGKTRTSMDKPAGTVVKKEKKVNLEERLLVHKIESYLKNLKHKLKGAPTAIQPRDLKQHL